MIPSQCIIVYDDYYVLRKADKALITYAIRYDMRDPPAPSILSSVPDKVVPFRAFCWYPRGSSILVRGLLFFRRMLIPQVPSRSVTIVVFWLYMGQELGLFKNDCCVYQTGLMLESRMADW